MSGCDELDPFRAQARDWLQANFPPALRGTSVTYQYDGQAPEGDALLWKQRMAEKGWGAPTWARDYGGGGLSGAQARILKTEMTRCGAYNPIWISLGLTMIGPTILDFGSEAQKRRHLPSIARGETVWCLGMSEPGAGSDLASLQARCEDKGDHWRINGQKVWTSGAHHADWVAVFVRTDREAKKHDGISVVLTDMRQPGIEARPIRLIGGQSPFCEVFFTDAVGEKDNLLGKLNGGWTVGKRLLQHERASQTAERGAPPVESVEETALRCLGRNEEGRLADPDVRSRLIANRLHHRAHGLTLARAQQAAGDEGPNHAVSILKTSATLEGQERAELTIEMLGFDGLGWEGSEFSAFELAAVRTWLSGKANSIAGGTYEINQNIIAKRVLGLPDPLGQG